MNSEIIEKLLDRQKTVYIASVDVNNYPNMKAMLTPRKRNKLKEFWFTTKELCKNNL